MFGNEDWINYCDCGEYLGPVANKLVCNDPKYGCGRLHRGLHCQDGGKRHAWVAPSYQPPPDSCHVCGALYYHTFIKTVDFSRKEKAYWRNIFKLLDGAVYQTQSLDLVADLKQRKYEWQRPKPRTNSYGPEVDGFLEQCLQDLEDETGDCCVDNRRFAATDSRADMRIFYRDEGCCGKAHKIVSFKGRKYIIGLNYGH